MFIPRKILIVVSAMICIAFIASAAKFPVVAIESEPENTGTEIMPEGSSSPTADHKIFMPMSLSRIGWVGELPVMLGLYPQGWLTQSTIDNEVVSLDRWSGKQLSILGTFLDIETPNYQVFVTDQLNIAWNNGYILFINLMSSRSAHSIANGDVDAALRSWAAAYRNFARLGNRMAYIAPLPEMNGYWTTYGLNPHNYKLAYNRIQRIFAEERVPADSIRWVFAPNGWTDPDDPPIADYYPGRDRVDVVGFSSYNFGYCPTNPYKSWSSPEKVFGSYLPVLQSVAPDKPIFVAQTGTTGWYVNGWSDTAKSQWIYDSYIYLSQIPEVKAIIYFNMQKDCNYTLYVKDQISFPGYQAAVQDPAFEYVAPGDQFQIVPDLSNQP